jgi:type IV secretory pathway VirB10-like protein
MSKLFTIGILGVLLAFLGLLSKQVKNVPDPRKIDKELVEKERQAAPKDKAAETANRPAIPATQQEMQKKQAMMERQQREQYEMMKAANSDKAKKEKAFENDRTLARAAAEAKDKKSAPKHPSGGMDLSGDWWVRRKPGTAGFAALEVRQKEEEAQRAKVLAEAMRQEAAMKLKKNAENLSKGIKPADDGHNH